MDTAVTEFFSLEDSSAEPSAPSHEESGLRDHYGFMVPNDYHELYRMYSPVWEREETEREAQWCNFLTELAQLNADGGKFESFEELCADNLQEGVTLARHEHGAPSLQRLRLEALVHGGVPFTIRGQAWTVFLDTSVRKQRGYYHDLVKRSLGELQYRGSLELDEIRQQAAHAAAALEDAGALHGLIGYTAVTEKALDTWRANCKVWLTQIEKDLPRTFPGLKLMEVSGRPALRRVLAAYSLHNSRVGYCQGLNFVVGTLLLFLDEEDAFWCACALLEDILTGYYDVDMMGMQVDQRVFKRLVMEHFPQLASYLEGLGADVSCVFVQWFLCVFVNFLPIEACLRVWDALFYYRSSTVLFKTALALLEVFSPALLSCSDVLDALDLLQSLAPLTYDSNRLIAHAFGPTFDGVTDARLTTLRREYREEVEAEAAALADEMAWEAGGGGGHPSVRNSGGRGNAEVQSLSSAAQQQAAPPPPTSKISVLKMFARGMKEKFTGVGAGGGGGGGYNSNNNAQNSQGSGANSVERAASPMLDHHHHNNSTQGAAGGAGGGAATATVAASAAAGHSGGGGADEPLLIRSPPHHHTLDGGGVGAGDADSEDYHRLPTGEEPFQYENVELRGVGGGYVAPVESGPSGLYESSSINVLASPAVLVGRPGDLDEHGSAGGGGGSGFEESGSRGAGLWQSGLAAAAVSAAAQQAKGQVGTVLSGGGDVSETASTMMMTASSGAGTTTAGGSAEAVVVLPIDPLVALLASPPRNRTNSVSAVTDTTSQQPSQSAASSKRTSAAAVRLSYMWHETPKWTSIRTSGPVPGISAASCSTAGCRTGSATSTAPGAVHSVSTPSNPPGIGVIAASADDHLESGPLSPQALMLSVSRPQSLINPHTASDDENDDVDNGTNGNVDGNTLPPLAVHPSSDSTVVLQPHPLPTSSAAHPPTAPIVPPRDDSATDIPPAHCAPGSFSQVQAADQARRAQGGGKRRCGRAAIMAWEIALAPLMARHACSLPSLQEEETPVGAPGGTSLEQPGVGGRGGAGGNVEAGGGGGASRSPVKQQQQQQQLLQGTALGQDAPALPVLPSTSRSSSSLQHPPPPLPQQQQDQQHKNAQQPQQQCGPSGLNEDMTLSSSSVEAACPEALSPLPFGSILIATGADAAPLVGQGGPGAVGPGTGAASGSGGGEQYSEPMRGPHGPLGAGAMPPPPLSTPPRPRPPSPSFQQHQDPQRPEGVGSQGGSGAQSALLQPHPLQPPQPPTVSLSQSNHQQQVLPGSQHSLSPTHLLQQPLTQQQNHQQQLSQRPGPQQPQSQPQPHQGGSGPRTSVLSTCTVASTGTNASDSTAPGGRVMGTSLHGETGAHGVGPGGGSSTAAVAVSAGMSPTGATPPSLSPAHYATEANQMAHGHRSSGVDVGAGSGTGGGGAGGGGGGAARPYPIPGHAPTRHQLNHHSSALSLNPHQGHQQGQGHNAAAAGQQLQSNASGLVVVSPPAMPYMPAGSSVASTCSALLLDEHRDASPAEARDEWVIMSAPAEPSLGALRSGSGGSHLAPSYDTLASTSGAAAPAGVSGGGGAGGSPQAAAPGPGWEAVSPNDDGAELVHRLREMHGVNDLMDHLSVLAQRLRALQTWSTTSPTNYPSPSSPYPFSARTTATTTLAGTTGVPGDSRSSSYRGSIVGPSPLGMMTGPTTAPSSSAMGMGMAGGVSELSGSRVSAVSAVSALPGLPAAQLLQLGEGGGGQSEDDGGGARDPVGLTASLDRLSRLQALLNNLATNTATAIQPLPPASASATSTTISPTATNGTTTTPSGTFPSTTNEPPTAPALATTTTAAPSPSKPHPIAAAAGANPPLTLPRPTSATPPYDLVVAPGGKVLIQSAAVQRSTSPTPSVAGSAVQRPTSPSSALSDAPATEPLAATHGASSRTESNKSVSTTQIPRSSNNFVNSDVIVSAHSDVAPPLVPPPTPLVSLPSNAVPQYPLPQQGLTSAAQPPSGPSQSSLLPPPPPQQPPLQQQQQQQLGPQQHQQVEAAAELCGVLHGELLASRQRCRQVGEMLEQYGVLCEVLGAKLEEVVRQLAEKQYTVDKLSNKLDTTMQRFAAQDTMIAERDDTIRYLTHQLQGPSGTGGGGTGSGAAASASASANTTTTTGGLSFALNFGGPTPTGMGYQGGSHPYAHQQQQHTHHHQQQHTHQYPHPQYQHYSFAGTGSARGPSGSGQAWGMGSGSGSGGGGGGPSAGGGGGMMGGRNGSPSRGGGGGGAGGGPNPSQGSLWQNIKNFKAKFANRDDSDG